MITLNRGEEADAQGLEHLPPVRPDTFPKQSIQVSPEEQASGRLSEETRALAALILTCRGYVILKDALPEERVRRLREAYFEIYEECRATLGVTETGCLAESQFQVQESVGGRATFWHRRSRWRIFPKLTGLMADPLLLANPFVMPVLEELLGPEFYCKFVSSDVCVKDAILQSPHSDIDLDDVFRNNRWMPRGFMVNVPLMECGLHNGPLEVWPGGSHFWSAELLDKFGIQPNVQDGRNPLVEQAAEFFPSVKVVLNPGEILIRDLTMWHRGTPNPTDIPRAMLSIAFFRKDRGFGYGDASYNLNREQYDALHPSVQQRFSYHFQAQSFLRKGMRKTRSVLKRLVRGGRG